jgi:hypothetical protein
MIAGDDLKTPDVQHRGESRPWKYANSNKKQKTKKTPQKPVIDEGQRKIQLINNHDYDK